MYLPRSAGSSLLEAVSSSEDSIDPGHILRSMGNELPWRRVYDLLQTSADARNSCVAHAFWYKSKLMYELFSTYVTTQQASTVVSTSLVTTTLPASSFTQTLTLTATATATETDTATATSTQQICAATPSPVTSTVYAATPSPVTSTVYAATPSPVTTTQVS
jgi:hypothetical protein